MQQHLQANKDRSITKYDHSFLANILILTLFVALCSLETRHYADIASFLLFMMNIARRYLMRQVFDLMQVVMSPHCLGTFTVIKPTG